ncbi:MAG: hypothetical protein IT317_05240 [Anaerolineales bacterium]|nr:hypothetical protein [Anaerolineales bacterium]
MAATAASWFYRAPENNAYLLAERVNGTFWDNRLGGVLLSTVRAESPFGMIGAYQGANVRMEWEPNKWLRLATSPAVPSLVDSVANILRRKPTLRFDDADGETVWEWRLEDADKRWAEVQGKAAFGAPRRLDTPT